MNPILLVGRDVARSWPQIEDFDAAVTHLGEECAARGIVAPERNHLVGILLMGYLIWGKERRHEAAH